MDNQMMGQNVDPGQPLIPTGNYPSEPNPSEPIPPTSYPPYPTEAPSVLSKKSKKPLIIGLIVALVIILLAAGGVWGYGYYSALPDVAAKKMIANIANVRSVEYNIATTSKTRQSGDFLNGDVEVIVSASGQSDMTNAASPKNSVAANFNIANFADVGFEAMSVDKVAYVRVTKLPSILAMLGGGEAISSIQGQWFKIDDASFEKLLQNDPAGQEMINKIKSAQSLNSDKVKQIKDSLFSLKVINLGQRLPNEKINNINTYHYKISVNKEELKKIIPEVISMAALQGQVDKITQDELDQLNKAIDKYSLPEGEIWIGQKDFLPYKLTLKSIQQEGEAINSFTVETLFKNYNQTFKIEAPADSKDVVEFFAPYLNPNFDGDNDGLSDKDEKLYKTNAQNPDTDGDGYKDGEEVQNGYDPLGPGKLTTPPLVPTSSGSQY